MVYVIEVYKNAYVLNYLIFQVNSKIKHLRHFVQWHEWEQWGIWNKVRTYWFLQNSAGNRLEIHGLDFSIHLIRSSVDQVHDRTPGLSVCVPSVVYSLSCLWGTAALDPVVCLFSRGVRVSEIARSHCEQLRVYIVYGPVRAKVFETLCPFF